MKSFQMLVFDKASANSFLPRRHEDRSGCFSLFFPADVHLLAGHKSVIDFLLTLTLPPHHQGEFRLNVASDHLVLSAEPLCE